MRVTENGTAAKHKGVVEDCEVSHDSNEATGPSNGTQEQRNGKLAENSPEDACCSSANNGVIKRCLPLTVFRDRRILDNVIVKLGVEYGMGTDRLVHWCGAQLQVGCVYMLGIASRGYWWVLL